VISGPRVLTTRDEASANTPAEAHQLPGNSVEVVVKAQVR